MNPYNPPRKGEKQTCKKCRWLPICIDPCDDCKNSEVVDDDGELLPGKEYCQFEQGEKDCRKIAGDKCQQYEPRLASSVDLELKRRMDALR